MRALMGMMFAALAAYASAAGGASELNLVRHRPVAAAPDSVVRLIVKLRDAPPSSAAQTRSAAPMTPDARLHAIAARHGLALDAHRQITSRMHALRVELGGAGVPLDAVLAQLRADKDVEYAVVDQRRYVHALTPDDPLYGEQWHLQVAPAGSTPSAIDATDAWDTTTGSSNLVIADIDTGVRFEHPDLTSRLLPGYCFISDAFVANSASCPGPDASDPGDWVTSADVNDSPEGECSGASPSYSSWHGTRVAGILGAITNNDTGVAGVTWSSMILPVRALGKCGGSDSDIITGMLWAAGIPVTVQVNGTETALTNPSPARIINMSLGGSGSCPESYQDAIGQILAKGIVIVASAGNETGGVDAPANCPGVIAVAGLREDGTKVGYSSFGEEVGLSAPAGNCVNTGAQQPCVYTITTTTNLGTQEPGDDDYTGEYYCYPDSTGGDTPGSYTNCTIGTNQYRTYNAGTSFSAPLVSGIAALMASVNGNLSTCEITSRLKASAQPFPQSSLDTSPQPPACPNTNAGGQCVCTNDGKTCGAGMASAPAALEEALRPIAAVSLPSSAVSGGQSFELNGAGSAAANNHVISSFQWTNVGSRTLTISGASSPTATVTAPSCGIGTVRLTVTDDGGRQDTADVLITPSSASSTAPATASATSSCSTTTPAVEVEVCPAAATATTGGAAQSFTADVANTSNTTVTWQVNGIVGGNATVGTISSSGEYTPPATMPSSSTVTITAVSAADPSVSSSAVVSLAAPKSGGGAMDWITLIGASLLLGRRIRRRIS